MPFHMSTTVVWGIAAGAAALLVVIGGTTVILCRRMRQKKQLARILTAGERRLSGYPGGHFSLTDEDVARMPGTRSVLRRPAHSSRGNSRGYAPVTSRECLPRQPVLASMSKAVIRDQTVPQNATSGPSWPLPRRLTRSSATPLAKLRVPPLAPITEKSAKILKDRAVPVEVQPVAFDGRDGDNTDGDNNKARPPVLDSCQSDIFTPAVLKPKPLFHDKPRSSSAGSIAQWSKAQVGEATVSKQEKALPMPRFPRSSSLCSQQPGLAPEKPMPPLPFNLPVPKRIQGIKSPTELSSRRTSGNSLFSGDTYILEDKALRPFSQAETDFTSISLASSSIVGSKAEGLGIFAGEDKDWKGSTLRESSSLCLPAKAVRPHTQAGSRKSLRVSIVNSLPRSESSGLSMSLLDHGPSRNTSSASISTGPAVLSKKAGLGVPRSAVRKEARLPVIPPASPLSKFSGSEDVKSQRASTSALQVVSGNRSSPLPDPFDERPSSWSTGNPFPWDSTTSMQPGKSSVMKDRAKGHRPQSAISISNNQPLLMPMKFLAHPGPIEEATPSRTSYPTPSLDLSKNDYFLPRPPSRITFDPQINPNPNMKTFHSFGGASYSPTLSVVDMYNSGANEASVLEDATPERKPIPDTDFTLPTPEELDLSRPIQIPETCSPSFNSRSSFLFPMPPPSRQSYSTNRRSPSSSPIRGPRALPSGHHPSKRVGKSLHNCSSKDLRKSIMAIRRMNSEAADLQPKLHQRYLSIGRTARTIFEDDAVARDDVFRDVQVSGAKVEEAQKNPGVVKGMPSTSVADGSVLRTPAKKMEQGLTWGSPRSLYDTSGFLREG